METNVTTKRTAANKVPAKMKAVEVDPFAVEVESGPVNKRPARKTAAADKAKIAIAAPVKKTVRKSAKTIVADPFAEVVTTASPVKKPAVKTAKATAKTVRAVAKTPKKLVNKVVKTVVKKIAKELPVDLTAEIAVTEMKVKLSATFLALAEPVLPELNRENRARLQMQTPTRLYFYWSIRENPWHTLRNVFGDDLGSYTLVLKLIDKKSGYEDIRQTEAEGNYWFDVEPDHTYQAEIGFYAPNRPYFRIIYSNIVATPRRGPSPRAATESDWKITANKFAEVLDVAGFSRDAVDVAMAGDDHIAAENTTQRAFTSLIGTSEVRFDGITAEDIRYAMIALASGVVLEDLRGKISAPLFAILQANAEKLAAGRAMSALTEHFDIDDAEFTGEQSGPAVYGASLVNFPRTLKTKALSPKYAPRYSPLSSHNLR